MALRALDLPEVRPRTGGSRPRLAIVSSRYPYGAQETYLDTELQGFVRAFDGVEVWPTRDDRFGEEPRPTPAKTVAVPLYAFRTFGRALREVAGHPWSALCALGRVLFDRSPLRTKLKNLAVLPKAFALASVARNSGIGHIHAYWLSTPATIAYVVSRMTGIPWSATAHRWDIYENNMVGTKLRSASFVRAISERGRRDLELRSGRRARVRTVHVGVAVPQRVAPLASTAPKTLRILCAASLVPVKGHRYLLEAMRIARSRGVDARLTLAGEGPLRGELSQLIRSYELQGAVEMPGQLRHATLLREVQSGAYDVAVLSSIEAPGGLMEGLPVALIEAMACGIPCIATDSGSMGELVGPDRGVLVPHSNSERLADAIVALASDPARRSEMGARARDFVQREFDFVRTTDTLVGLLLSEGTLSEEALIRG